MRDETMSVVMTGAQLGHLTTAAGDGIAVALAARARIENRTKSFVDVFLRIEGFSISIERGLIDQAVRLIVETRGGLGERYRGGATVCLRVEYHCRRQQQQQGNQGNFY